MERISVMIPKPYLRDIERFIDSELFPNRSEAIRTAVRDFIKQEFYKEKVVELKKLKTELGLIY